MKKNNFISDAEVFYQRQNQAVSLIKLLLSSYVQGRTPAASDQACLCPSPDLTDSEITSHGNKDHG